MAHAVGLQLQAVEHLGDLRDREQVEFAAKRDQGGATARASLDGELFVGGRLLRFGREPLGYRSSDGFR